MAHMDTGSVDNMVLFVNDEGKVLSQQRPDDEQESFVQDKRLKKSFDYVTVCHQSSLTTTITNVYDNLSIMAREQLFLSDNFKIEYFKYVPNLIKFKITNGTVVFASEIINNNESNLRVFFVYLDKKPGGQQYFTFEKVEKFVRGGKDNKEYQRMIEARSRTFEDWNIENFVPISKDNLPESEDDPQKNTLRNWMGHLFQNLTTFNFTETTKIIQNKLPHKTEDLKRYIAFIKLKQTLIKVGASVGATHLIAKLLVVQGWSTERITTLAKVAQHLNLSTGQKAQLKVLTDVEQERKDMIKAEAKIKKNNKSDEQHSINIPKVLPAYKQSKKKKKRGRPKKRKSKKN